ncbi:serine/threonine-protein kinase TNNI3K-like isoform X2 [Gigantopelta aegis]|uniref:serine/threonine-protein kinase TNNI3K-like isoform X2 n=1 Tax=Gigantopelta aegis TaxID=1735272 RepID=UPI001B88AE7F|nr:serine/threonine-protein kinase TNNI3K-like isoform X2 [Gigantopelta aegis]
MARMLIEAIQRSDVGLAKKILQGKNYTCIDCQTARRHGTSLFWASCRGLLEIAQLLIANNANVNIATAWGSTPLHAAADSNNCEIIKLLLKSGANVNVQTEAGDTPCHLAAYRGHAQAVQLLVEGGADIGITNNRYHLPVHEAEQQSHLVVADYLQAVSLLGEDERKATTRTRNVPARAEST